MATGCRGREDWNAMRVPSGAQTGDTSRPESTVRRDLMLRAMSITQMSTFSGVPVPNAAVRRDFQRGE
jgi:hypothetical protein